MRRIVGLETEYGVLEVGPRGKYREAEILRTSASGAREWRGNGSAIYMDVGQHPEYNTPECATVRDAILYDRAGERIMAQIFKEPSREREFFLSLQNPKSRLLLFKNNRSAIWGEETFGCHENYMFFLPEEMRGLPFVKMSESQLDGLFGPLIPFLATRPIISGSGWYEDMGRGQYLCSQRAQFIHKIYGDSTVSPRAIISVARGDEAFVGKSSSLIKRLHLILGDSNMLEIANFLKVGTTYLLLNLIEAGRAPRIRIENPVRIMRSLTPDSIRVPAIKTTDGRKLLSAVNVQRIYAEAAAKYLPLIKYEMNKKQAEEADLIIKLWFEALDALEKNDEKWLKGRNDWFTKRHIISQNLKRFSPREKAQIVNWGMALNRESAFKKDYDIFYHETAEAVLLNKIHEKWPEGRLLKEEEIALAMKKPPQDTRALLRGRVIDLAKNYGQAPIFSWDDVSYRGLKALLFDPFSTSSGSIDLICEKIKNTIK